MREIKFRAWNGDKIVPDVFVAVVDGETRWLDALLKGDEPNAWLNNGLMQYTGLKDKNGVEIYEGDIVRAFSVYDMHYEYNFEANNNPSNVYKITFSDGCFQFDNAKQWSDGCNDWRSIENVELFKCEVIGNIYENPELLKGDL